jgi:LPXTG-motif cell wall-anchored protein
MIYFQMLKKRPYTMTLIAVTCAFSLISACSHKQHSDNKDTAAADAATDPNAPPTAGTDAVPAQGADGQAAANGAPADPNAPATAQAADGSQPPASGDASKPKGKGKGKKVAHHRAKSGADAPAPAVPQDNAAAMQGGMPQDSAAMNAPAQPQQPQAPQNTSMNSMNAAPPQQPPAQNMAPQAMNNNTNNNAAANMQRSNPEESAQARNPASPHAAQNHAANNDAATGEITGEGGSEGMFGGSRTIIMAIFGVGLLGGGGFAFWKKRQAAV